MSVFVLKIYCDLNRTRTSFRYASKSLERKLFWLSIAAVSRAQCSDCHSVYTLHAFSYCRYTHRWNSISQAIRHKTMVRTKLRNTTRCYSSVIDSVLTSLVTTHRYWQRCLSVRHTSQLHYGSRSLSHVYQVTNCSHVAYRTQTTKFSSPSRTVRCRSGGWDSRSELPGTREVGIFCMCKRSLEVHVRSQMNPVNVLVPTDPF